MSILVIGGYGLLGSWVGSYLGKERERVILFDLRKRDLNYLQDIKENLVFFAEMC